jgi:transposase
MPRTRPPYPPEFRLEAVRLLRAGVRTPKQLAAELGCSEQTLRNWWRQDQADRGERGDVLSSEERQRLRELERENKVLRQEREILKRAALVVEADPAQDLVLGALEVREAAAVDELRLEGRDPRFGHRVDAPIVK